MQWQAWKRPMTFLASVIAIIAVIHLAFAGENSPAEPRGKQMLREGTRLQDTSGRFEAVGERVSFVLADSGESVRVLENLALERISQVLVQNPAGPQWTISGTLTEYRGSNFLLVTKAIQTGQAAPRPSTPASGIGTRTQVDYSVPEAKATRTIKQEPPRDKHP